VHTPLVQHRPTTGGAACTATCQSAPELLSHVPLPLLNTTSTTVAAAGTTYVYVHGPVPLARVIAGSGAMTFVQPLYPM
jgi:hypothetical protein